MKRERGKIFWGLQIPGWLLFTYLIYAQGITAFNYNLGVSMGTQESAETITEIGTAFYYGFAFGDLIIYIPLLFAGLIGHFKSRKWGIYLFGAALGITVYWPIVCLASLVAARGAAGWNIMNEVPYWVVLPIIAMWGLWGLLALIKETRPYNAMDGDNTAP